MLQQLSVDHEAAVQLGIAASQITKKPMQVLSLQVIAQLIQRGYFKSPTFDPQLVQRLATLPEQNFWGDRYVEVRMLTPAQVREAYPGLS